MNTHLKLRAKHWLEQDCDPKTRKQLQALIDSDNEAELKACFSGRLAFGTAGLRGIVGCGPMRMNRLVVQQTSAGLGQYLVKQFSDAKQRGVVIGFDGRNDSKQFAHDAAAVLTAQGIKVYLTYQIAATPIVAFGVRSLNAVAGIVITASHNPPQYNGYKVYWDNGAQIIPPHDSGIAACIEQVATTKIPLASLNEVVGNGLLQMLDNRFYQDYRHAIQQADELQCFSDNEAMSIEQVSIAYSAMHGVGGQMAQWVLEDIGVTAFYSVDEQALPNGDFPSVKFPNPEEKGAMDLVIALAKKQQALLACANDPDADRLAVAARTPEGDYQMLTGDQVGALLGHYLLSHAPNTQKLVANSIVSSSLLGKIARDFNAQCLVTLTGFKWLANIAMSYETEDNRFLFAYEEALGYCVGPLVKDKDGLSALVAFARLSAELISQGMTVWDRLAHIYQKYGLYKNQQVSLALQPDSPNIGEYFRQQPPSAIGGDLVLSRDDLLISERVFHDGATEFIPLPSSDVLIYRLASGARVIVRPSGTEPKVKCYYEWVEPMGQNDTLKSANQRADKAITALIDSHQASLP